MAGGDAAREQAAARLRQRLWGATVLIALAVIVLPLLLDGSGSESQFRRVERLREEPPRIVTGGAAATADEGGPVYPRASDVTDPDADAVSAHAAPAQVTSAQATSAQAASVTGAGAIAPPAVTDEERRPDIRVGEDDPPDYFRERAADTPPASARTDDGGLPRAWVVQAGSFGVQANAVAVRDRLRRAGHPSFVADASTDGASLYRVQVGPMVDEARAERLRDEVMALLGREAIVVAYP